MIDLHCHILPGVDDGSRSLRESLSMARMAVEDGIRIMVATAHTLNGVYLNPARNVALKVDAFKKVLAKHRIPLTLYGATEVHLIPGLVRSMKEGKAGTINWAGKYLLLELPAQTIPKGVKDEIFSLKLHGITPIIVHPERNAFISRDADILYDLVGMGALSQITAMSVTGGFGAAAQRSAETLLERRLCHILATDGHSADTRPPLLSRAVQEAGDILKSMDEAKQMVTRAPAAVLSGKPLEVPEPRPARKKGRFWKRSS